MLGFTPFKRHANKFNYMPRYYDPEKEAREQRRAELARRAAAEDAGREYQPRTVHPHPARSPRRAAVPTRRRRAGVSACWKMAAGAVLVLLFIYLLYPKLADVFLRARTSAPAQTETAGAESRGATDLISQAFPTSSGRSSLLGSFPTIIEE